jgi:hypothetical protein
MGLASLSPAWRRLLAVGLLLVVVGVLLFHMSAAAEPLALP